MRDYRHLYQEEINVLENNSCWAENWDNVMVDEAFTPYGFHRVIFYGNIRLGKFENQVEVTKGFTKHAGINDATLRNVTVGDNCLIEKIGNLREQPLAKVIWSVCSMRWVMVMSSFSTT